MALKRYRRLTTRRPTGLVAWAKASTGVGTLRFLHGLLRFGSTLISPKDVPQQSELLLALPSAHECCAGAGDHGLAARARRLARDGGWARPGASRLGSAGEVGLVQLRPERDHRLIEDSDENDPNEGSRVRPWVRGRVHGPLPQPQRDGRSLRSCERSASVAALSRDET